MNRRRLLFYTHALTGGGAERVWALVAGGLARRGYDIDFGVDFDADANEALLPSEVRRFRFGPGHGRAVRNLSRYLKNERPVAAFSAVGATNLKLLAARMLSGWRGAAVLSQHGRLDAESRFLGRLGYRLTPMTSRMAAATICVSDDLNHYLTGRFHARADRVVTIHNGFVLPARSELPSADALAARDDIILTLGRLVPEKRMGDLIQAMTLMRRSAQLVILGEGPERARLEAQAAAGPAAGRVIFKGYLNEPWPEFAKAKVLAVASATEAFGNTIVEALARGIGVVATRCGGPEEVLGQGRFGRLVPVGAPAALATALDEALDSPGDPLAHRARAEAFSLDAALDRYEALIRRVAP